MAEPIEGRFCGACGWELLLRRQWSEQQGIKTYLVCSNPNCQWVCLHHVEPHLKSEAGEQAAPAAP